MPRRPDIPCAGCGELMWRGTGALPPGEAKCNSCWRSEIVHGSVNRGYRKGCRCAECRQANTEAGREYRAARKQRTGLVQARRTYAPQLPCVSCGKTVSARSAKPTCKRCRRGLSISRERRQAIYERDGWTCGFCGYDVDRTLGGYDEFGPTLDHIVPRSMGGTDDEDNLRLVHRYCNTARSNREALTIDELVGR